MSNPNRGIPQKGFVYLLVLLAAIAGSLFMIFSLVATTEVSESLALVLFLAAGGLLVVGYMIGLIVLALLAILLLSKRGNKPSKGPSGESSIER